MLYQIIRKNILNINQQRLYSLFPKESAVVRDPTRVDFSPLGSRLSTKNQLQSPYATSFPSEQRIPNTTPLRRPYERLIKLRKLMKPSRLGKRQEFDAWVVVGDRNGSAAMTHSTSQLSAKAVKKSIKNARQSLKHYDLYEGRTLYHDIECEYKGLRMRMYQKPPGYSIRAQRNAYDVCHAVGIQDIAIEILQGKTNPIKISRAVFHALDNLHKTPEQVAMARGKCLKEIK